MREFLESSEYIDWTHPAVIAKASELAKGCPNEIVIARRCYHFVRDTIRHSWDFKLNPVTCKASEALLHGTGYCYTKSHLLAALLRANQIPAGLCYQRLTVETEGPRFCLHGLNAVYLQGYGWYRVDARGNKSGVTAEFSPPVEQLAFTVSHAGEADLPEIWPEPLPAVIKVLSESTTYDEVYRKLPDIHLMESLTRRRKEEISSLFSE